jgi:3-hydroxyisobutyrate dehydrogenase-like beta-hydroxyacid dehydrogenase
MINLETLAGPRGAVGIIGVGLVGTALAELLLEKGYNVGGYDIAPPQLRNLARIGGTAHRSSAEVFAAYPQVILSLPNSEVVLQVLAEFGPGIPAGCQVIDTSTGDPAHSRKAGAELVARGVEYLDATLGGSSRQIRNHEAICLCGGTPRAFERAGDLLRLIAAQVFHLGPAGAGAAMKLVLNLVLGLNRAALAEGLAYAIACGIDAAKALEVLKAGPAYSRAMDVKGEKMLRHDYKPEARLAQHLKDVRLILATGEQAGVRLPLSAAHRALLEAAEAAGFGAADNSAVFEAYRKRN